MKTRDILKMKNKKKRMTFWHQKNIKIAYEHFLEKIHITDHP